MKFAVKNGMILIVTCLTVTLMVWHCDLSYAAESGSKTVKIGCSLPLHISWGVEIKRALELGVELINDTGGLTVGNEKYKIDMTIYNDKYKAELGQTTAERLISKDGVKAIVGTCASTAAVGCLPVVQQMKIPLFTSSFTERLLDPKLKYVYATTTARSVDSLYPLILKANPQIKTAVLAAQDDETGHNMTEKAKKILESYGIKIIESMYFPRAQRDYAPIATKVASLNPDFLAIPGFGGVAEKMGLMAKAFHTTSWRGIMFVTAAPVMKDLMEICPGGEAEGLYIPLTDFTTLSDPPALAVQMRKACEKKYGEWREVGPYWSLPLWFFAAAVEKAGSFEASKIDEAMSNLEIDTPIGKARTFKRPDLNNTNFVDVIVAPGLAQIKGKEAIFISSMTIDEAIQGMEKAYGFNGQWN